MRNHLGYIILISAILASCSNKPNINNQLNNEPLLKPYKENTDAATCDPTWSKENTIINHWLNEPATLHPTNEYTSNKSFVFNYIHSFILVVDPATLELQPDLVKTLPKISEDGLTYEFELKDGITWDDGSPITSDDVLFTFKVNAHPDINNAFAKPYIETLADVQIVDEKKFKFVLSKKYILNDYISTYFPILQKKVYDAKGSLDAFTYANIVDTNLKNKSGEIQPWLDEMNGPLFGSDVTKLNGSGPYKVESWEKGQTITLVKKQNHWSAKQDKKLTQYAAYPEKIIFKTIADENATKIEFNNQSIDVTTFLTTKALMELEQNETFKKNYHFAYLPAYNSTYLMMNNKPDGTNHKKLFDDVKVRQAMAYLTPVQNVIDIVYNGKADRLVGPMHPQKRGFNKNLIPVLFDLDKGNALLEQAGWKDTDKDGIRDKVLNGKKTSFEFKLMYPTNSPVAKDIADLVVEQYTKAGLKVTLDGLPMDQLVPKATSHDFDMTFFAFGQSGLPDDFEQLWGTNSWTTNGSNLSGFGNAQSDALIDSIKTELDWNKRIPMLERFQKMMYDDQPVIFFLSTSRKIVIHKRFGNATMYYERPGVVLNNLRLLCTPNGSTNVQ